MKIYIPNTSEQSIGGGWTFLRNFRKGARGALHFVDRWKDCDIYFIVAATMTSRDEAYLAKAAGKGVIFRVDNVPRDSRNRGTAFSRMRDFANISDVVVYQSEWARQYAGYICGDGPVIMNGVDTDIFKSSGIKIEDDDLPLAQKYLYVHYNRDENKRFPEALYFFHQEWKRTRNSELWLVGRFEDKLVEYNFDLFAGEPMRYFGVIENPLDLAKVMRSAHVLLAPYFMDAAPNTVAEAIACGMEVALVNPIGGTQEIIDDFKSNGVRTVERMAEDYINLFKLALSDTAATVET